MTRLHGLLCAVLGFAACAPAKAPRRALPSAQVNIPASSPVAQCIAPSMREELACDGARATVAAWTWPDARHLFHYPERPRWQSTVMPPALTAEASAQEPRIAAAEKLFASASWKPARDAFTAFLQAVPPDHGLRAYALARRAQAAANQGQFDVAVDDLLALVARPTALDALARRDLAIFYARSTKRATDASSLLRETALVEATADAYVDAGRYDDATTILVDLAANASAAKRCTYGARQLAVAIARHPGQRKRLLDLAVQQREMMAGPILEQLGAKPTDEEQECRDATVALIGELALAWQVEAIGSGGIRGSGDAQALRAVETLYSLLDEWIAADELRASSLAWIAPINRPTRFRARFAIGEVAYFRKDWEACGPAFARAYEIAPEPLRATAATKAARCYLQMVAERSKSPKDEAVPLGEREARLLEWGARAVCGGDDDLRTDIELARGRALYAAHEWKRAAGALEHLAFVGGEGRARQAAAMYLVALHRAGCTREVEVDRARLVALHCSGADTDDANGPSVLGLTVSERRAISPCEAMRALGAPPPPLPAPPPKPLTPRITADFTSVSGALVPEYVAWVSQLHLGKWQACYDLALGRDPFTEGTAWLSFTIDRNGGVSHADVGGAVTDDRELRTCLRRVSEGLSFAQPEGGSWNVRWDLELSRTRGARLIREPVLRVER